MIGNVAVAVLDAVGFDQLSYLRGDGLAFGLFLLLLVELAVALRLLGMRLLDKKLGFVHYGGRAPLGL